MSNSNGTEKTSCADSQPDSTDSQNVTNKPNL